MTCLMLHDQQVVLDWIAEEKRQGWNRKAMPFPLEKFRHIRESLLRAGLVTKTETGRYVPA